MRHYFLIILIIFSAACSAMEKWNINFADVTLDGMNNFARQYSVMTLTDYSYKTLRVRLQELRISKASDELIAMQFYTAEKIKDSRSIKRLLTLVNLRMHGIESPCLPHIPNITMEDGTELPKSNCTFMVMTES